MATVAELVVKIEADIGSLQRGIFESKLAIADLQRSVDRAGGSSGGGGGFGGLGRSISGAFGALTRMNRAWLSWIGNMTGGIPVLGSLTNGLGALAPLLSAVQAGTVVVAAAVMAWVAALALAFAAVTALLDVIGTLIAFLADLALALAPVLAGFALLGGAVFLGVKTALTSGYKAFEPLRDILKTVGAQFAHLGIILGERFMPYIIQALQWVSRFLLYADKLAHMSLGDAIASFSRHGIHMLEQLNQWIYRLVSTPIKLIFGIGFGGGGVGSGDSQRIQAGVQQMLAPWMHLGGQLVGMFQGWFGTLHLTRDGIRLGHELLSGLGSAMGGAGGLGTYFAAIFSDALHTGFRMALRVAFTRGGAMVGGGAAAGGAIGGALGSLASPMGTAIGVALGGAIGASLGGVLNHYWPRIWGAMKRYALDAVNAIHDFVVRLLGPTVWHQVESAAASVWNLILALMRVVVAVARVMWGVMKVIWQVFDDLVIKTGAWKVLILLLRGAVLAVANVVHAVADTFTAILGVVLRIVDAIRSAVGVAGELASKLGGVAGAVGGATSWVGSVLGGIPHADGGIITRPLVAGRHLFGEAGPEAVIPLSNLDRYTGSGGGVVHVHLHNPLILGDRTTARATARWLAPLLKQQVFG